MRSIVRVGMPLVFVAVSAALAHAQGMGQSIFGSSALGGGSLGSTGSFTSGFGNAGFGSTRFGTGSGSLGSGGFGNAGFGSTRFGSGGMGDFNSGGVFGVQGMSGMSGTGGQNFVGRSGSDMQALNQMGQAGSNFFNQMNRNMRRNQRDQTAQPAVASSPQPVRVDLKVAFSSPQQAPTAVETKLRARLAKILPQHNMTQPAINMEGDTVILSGVAASESEILVLERLVSLEPGVRQVRNEMTVAGAAN